MSKTGRGGPCVEAGCTGRAHSAGLCHVHYVAGRPPCSVYECDKPSGMTRGLCPMHYQRWRKYGTHELPARRTDPERFWSAVSQEGECWVWNGFRDRHGYGRFHEYGAPSVVLTHRWSYEFMVAEIPDGLVLDHLCRNPPCVNPWHLDPVTQKVNMQRARPYRTYPQRKAA